VAQEFRLPDIGEGLTEAEVVQWLVDVGDPVGVDQPLAELETDKAVTDISSPYAGVVLYRGAENGATLRVGEILVVVGYEGEEWTPPDLETEGAEAAPIVGTLADQAILLGVSDSEQADAAADRPKALPLVRKLAREHGIDLEDIRGSGPHGRITRDDVQAAIDGPLPDEMPVVPEEPIAEVVATESLGQSPVDDEPEAPVVELDGDTDRVPMSRLRRTIADRMSRSWSEIPHVTAFDSADATRLIAARRALANRAQMAMPIEALIIKAVIPALRAFPEFNASVDNDDLILKRFYNIGVAIDTDEGLIVPVVKKAGDRGVADLATAISDLAGSARSRELSTADLSGVTFTVSNIGAVGGGFGTPIVPLGTTAILSVGRADEQPVVRDGKVTSAVMMPVSLSYDHRVIDGGLGRRFLAMVVENLEEPALFLAE
jgi:pyruvate dehydrogenase E2 component (dihydrolipoamide acetyltransferase)